MEVRESDVAGIPPGNVHATDWYALAVAVTCRWLATAPMRPTTGAHRLTRSPASKRAQVAYEELIEAEYLAAETLEQRRPDIAEHEPGWCEGVRGTLRWAWRRTGPPPLEVAEFVAR